MSEYHGHVTMADGSHVPLTADEAAAIWDECQRRKAERAAKLPDEKAAIDSMFEAFTRLKELGWSEAQYCPKDGSSFHVIEPGSTGVFIAHYSGEWPTGTWWVEDAGDVWPSRPVLFKRFPEAQAEYDRKMAEAAAKYQAEITPPTTGD